MMMSKELFFFNVLSLPNCFVLLTADVQQRRNYFIEMSDMSVRIPWNEKDLRRASNQF